MFLLKYSFQDTLPAVHQQCKFDKNRIPLYSLKATTSEPNKNVFEASSLQSGKEKNKLCRRGHFYFQADIVYSRQNWLMGCSSKNIRR